MDIESFRELSEVIALMRAEGVLYLKTGDTEITLGPALPKQAAQPAVEDKAEIELVETPKPTRRNPLLDHPALKNRR